MAMSVERIDETMRGGSKWVSALEQATARYPEAQRVEGRTFRVDELDAEPTHVVKVGRGLHVGVVFGDERDPHHVVVVERCYAPRKPREVLDELLRRKPELMADVAKIARGR
jgi:hypothetical protein